jgi:ABC-type glycerol-3-phosphate transport system permease component
MFTFNFAWEEFLIALTLINSADHRTLPIGLSYFVSEYSTAWGPLFAASVIATIPSFIVYLISQRSFKRGVSIGGIR